MPRLEKWHPKYWIIVINSNLAQTRIESDFKGRGIKAFWGRDIYGDKSKEKIMYVWYPKSQYTEYDIQNRIISQYEDCPLCKIGRDIQNSIFKYKKNNHKDNYKYRIGKKTMFGKISSYFKGKSMDIIAPYGGQGAATALKIPLSMITTDLGNKIISGIAGGAGNILNEWLNKYASSKQFLRSFFTSLMYTPFDPSAGQLRAMRRQAGDLVQGLKYKSFNTFSGAIFEDPQEVINAIKGWIPSFKGFGKMFSKRSYRRPLGNDEGIAEVTPEHVTSYNQSGSFDTRKSLITY